ncbi:MAG: histidine kinase [Flavobacteriaceae bacterium]|nr:histidine kinase [Flavobacteriaceae bacterium]
MESLDIELKSFAIYFLYGLIIGGANIYLVDYLDKRVSWKDNPKRRLIIGFFGTIIVSLIAVVLVRFIMAIYNGDSFEYFLLHEKPIHYFYTLVISLVIVLFFHAFYFYKSLTEKKLTESEFVAKTETAKYESLKSQLDPHFLFNSLNVLVSLIGENPDKAERFTTKLSKVYRYVLEQKDKDLIPLQEELDFANTYMELLKMRFEESVVFELPKSDLDPNLKIVPLSLQILLENAVKHNVINKENPLVICIYLKGDCLCVENKLHLKSILKKSTHVGLKNIEERYALITKRKIKIIKNEDRFQVNLPLLTQKIKNMKTSNTSQINRYLKAVERVKEIKSFYASLIAYCIVMPFIIFIYYRYSPHTIQWFWFPMFGWGMGLTFQGFKAFNYYPILGSDWEDRKIKEFINEDDKQYWK